MATFVYDAENANFDQHTVSVGNTETAFPTPTNSVQPGQIYVQAPSTNTLSVVIGFTGVTSDLAHGGIELAKGVGILLPVNTWSKLKCIAGDTNQKLLVNYLSTAQ